MSYDSVVIRIAVAWRDLRRIKTTPLSEAIPQGQLDTMDVVSRMGSTSMVELSAALRIDASTATRAVDRLVDAGIASRCRSDEDARTVMVKLTKEGQTLERRLTTERLVQVELILADLDDDERLQVAVSMERLLAAIELSG